MWRALLYYLNSMERLSKTNSILPILILVFTAAGFAAGLEFDFVAMIFSGIIYCTTVVASLLKNSQTFAEGKRAEIELHQFAEQTRLQYGNPPDMMPRSIGAEHFYDKFRFNEQRSELAQRQMIAYGGGFSDSQPKLFGITHSIWFTRIVYAATAITGIVFSALIIDRLKKCNRDGDPEVSAAACYNPADYGLIALFTFFNIIVPSILHMKIASDLRGWQNALADTRRKMDDFLYKGFAKTTAAAFDLRNNITQARLNYLRQAMPGDLATLTLSEQLNMIAELVAETTDQQQAALTLTQAALTTAHDQHQACLEALLTQTADLLEDPTFLSSLTEAPVQFLLEYPAQTPAFTSRLRQRFLQLQDTSVETQRLLAAVTARKDKLETTLTRVQQGLQRISQSFT